MNTFKKEKICLSEAPCIGMMVKSCNLIDKLESTDLAGILFGIICVLLVLLQTPSDLLVLFLIEKLTPNNTPYQVSSNPNMFGFSFFISELCQNM